MTAKEYLNQVRAFDEYIKQEKYQLEDLKNRTEGISAVELKERVQTSTQGDTLCKNVVRCIELETKINDDIVSYMEQRNDIIKQIQSLDNVKYSELLYKRYVKYERLEQIACEMHYTYDWIKHVHGIALQKFESRWLE